MSKYIFPLNYKYAEKLLGIIEYKVLIPFAVYGGILLIILYNLHFSFFMSTGIFIVLFLPPLLLCGTNINGESAFSFLLAIYKYKKNSKIYLYKNDCKIDEKTILFVHRGEENDF